MFIVKTYRGYVAELGLGLRFSKKLEEAKTFRTDTKWEKYDKLHKVSWLDKDFIIIPIDKDQD